MSDTRFHSDQWAPCFSALSRIIARLVADLFCGRNSCSCQISGCIQFGLALASDTTDAVLRKPFFGASLLVCGGPDRIEFRREVGPPRVVTML